jgi:putative DNA primase/helicase
MSENIVCPIPGNSPQLPKSFPFTDDNGETWQHFAVTHYTAFRNPEGKILRYVCRCDNGPDGKKITPPLTLWDCNGVLKWKFKGAEQPYSIYNLDRLTARPADLILIVEGEVKAETCQSVLDIREGNNITILTWQNGTGGVRHSDWSPVIGRTVVFWPDNDIGGIEAMNIITGILQGQQNKVFHLTIPADKPENWDVKDAILIDGWNREQVIKFINDNRREAPDLNYADGNIDDEPVEDAPPREYAAVDMPFRCLGFQAGCYFIMPDAARQVLAISCGSLNSVLLSLAPLQWYEMNFMGKKGPNWKCAIDFIIRECEKAGPYNHEGLRGRGAWMEDKTVVMHLGDKLIVDGKESAFKDHKSRYIYESAQPLANAVADPLPLTEANKLLEFLTALCWETKLSAYYVSGWTVLAPVCGALDWRPHLWITGGAGTGKTSVIKHIIKPCVMPFAINAIGGTSSAGIRNRLRNSGFSIIYDEIEGEDQHSQQVVQAILELARVGSSESDATIFKGSQDQKGIEFLIRSMFCLSSIGVNADKQADKTRFTIAQLRNGNLGKTEWMGLLQKIHDTITPEWAARLRGRTVKMLPLIKRNAEVFSLAISEMVSSSRAGDQHGSLLAGCYSLTSDHEITLDAARKWVTEKDWAEVRQTHESSDEQACCDSIMQTIIHESHSDISIAEILKDSTMQVGDDFETEVKHIEGSKAKQILARHGIKVEGTTDEDRIIYIADSHQMIKKFLERTPWTKTYGRILKRIPGAIAKTGSKFHGITCRSTGIPWKYVFND